MASTAREGSVGDLIHHTTGVRYRVVGSGNLESTLKSLDDVNTQPLTTIAMTTAPGRLPNILANFVEQRTYLRTEVTEMNAWFRINRIIIFMKPVYTGYPQ